MKNSIRRSKIESILKEAREHDSYMSKPQLFRIINMASELYKIIEDEEQIPDWAESHIAKCEQMMQSVHGKIMHEKVTGKR
jgi:hypothetical protein